MKKRIFYAEWAYVAALFFMACGSALTARSDFGMSMIVAPAYILHLKISEILPWFSFGVAEYLFQGYLVLLTALVMRRFKLSYLFSFVTALLYGTLLDIAVEGSAYLPTDFLAWRCVWFGAGLMMCCFGVALFFNTYISPEAYELLVKELASKPNAPSIHTIKVIYDVSSTLLSVLLSFLFFGFGVFKGVYWGTVVSAALNGFLISRFCKLLERFFIFKNRFDIEKYF